MQNLLSNKTSTSPDASKTETTAMSSAMTADRYGSTPMKDKSVSRFYVPFCGLVFYVLAFFGLFCSACLREGLSVAIVAMVNQTTVTEIQTSATDVSDEGQCPKEPEVRRTAGEFNWNRVQEGVLLAAFYYGFVLTPIPGGWLADRFGGKWLFGGCILVSSVVSLLTPAAARVHIGLLIALQVLSGLGEGVMRPAIQAMVARWSAQKYHSIVVNGIETGMEIGDVVAILVAGVLCDYGFAGGWPSVFYVFGMVSCVWSAAWFVLCYNSPFTHPLISTTERQYWEKTISADDLVERPPTPLREIFTSAPAWALAIAGFANNWGFLTMTTCLPLYMHDVMGLDMTWNGALSAIAFTGSAIFTPIVGLAADWLRFPGRLSTNVVRKGFVVVGFALSGLFLILVGYTGCNQILTVAVIFVYMSCVPIAYCTIIANPLDLAPVHAGTLMGLTSTLSNVASIAAPLVVGALTVERSVRSEWQNVFFLAGGVYAFGAVVFLVFGSGNRQGWADAKG